MTTNEILNRLNEIAEERKDMDIIERANADMSETQALVHELFTRGVLTNVITEKQIRSWGK